jgi:hypothetical protein
MGTGKSNVCASCQRSKVKCDRGSGAPKAQKRPRVTAPKEKVIAMEVDTPEDEEEEGWGASIDEKLGRIHDALADISVSLSGLTAIAGRLLVYVVDNEERRMRESKREDQGEEGEKISIFTVEDRGAPEASTSSSAPSTMFVNTP